MKALLLVCIVMLSAVSVGAQCTHIPLGKPLRVSLLMEEGTPIVVQNAFVNGLRAIPDAVVKTGVTSDIEDVVVFLFGTEIKNSNGGVMGYAWYFRVYRYWFCGTQLLEETLDGGMTSGPFSLAQASAQEAIAGINVKTFEKLRQERDASH